MLQMHMLFLLLKRKNGGQNESKVCLSGSSSKSSLRERVLLFSFDSDQHAETDACYSFQCTFKAMQGHSFRISIQKKEFIFSSTQHFKLFSMPWAKFSYYITRPVPFHFSKDQSWSQHFIREILHNLFLYQPQEFSKQENKYVHI